MANAETPTCYAPPATRSGAFVFAEVGYNAR